MNTVSTDLPTEVQEQLQAAFAAAQTTLRQREEDDLIATLKAEEEQDAKRNAEWAAPLKVLTTRLPEWIHKYIQAPTAEYQRWHDSRSEIVYSFVLIEVPGCNPIAAWAECKGSNIRLEVTHPELRREDDGGLWTVANLLPWYWMDWHQIKSDGEDDIAVALFKAHDAYLQYLELMAQAEQRNAREAERAAAPKPTPAPATPDPIEQARQLVNMLSWDQRIKGACGAGVETDNADDRTLVLAGVGLAIAYHISRVADALEEK